MKEFQLNSKKSAFLELKPRSISHMEVLIHEQTGSRILKYFSFVVEKSRKLIRLKSSDFKEGTYIYVVKQNGEQVDFGRIVSK